MHLQVTRHTLPSAQEETRHKQQGAPWWRRYLSELPEASRYSLGWNWTTLTPAVWEVNSVMVFPWIRSHS